MTSLWFGADLSRLNAIALEFDQTPLQDWGLSSRTLNALLRYDLKMTAGDVIRADESFASIRGLGTAGIEELRTKVSQLLVVTDKRHNINASVRGLLSLDDAQARMTHMHPFSKTLPEKLQEFPLSYLHLDMQTHNALMEANIVTIGQLYRVSSAFIGSVKNFHSNSLGNLNSSLIKLISTIEGENDASCLQYWKSRDIIVVPPIDISSDAAGQCLAQLHEVIEEVLRQEVDERAWIIIQRRFGLMDVEKLTLEDIAGAYNLSRERVRQLEEKALKVLQQVLVEQLYTGKPYQVHSDVQQMISMIRNIVEAEQSKVILETKLFERICQKFKVEAKKTKSSLFLVLTLMGIERIEFDYPYSVPAWGYFDREKRNMLINGVKRLDDLLTQKSPLSYSDFDIIASLNKKAKKSEKITLAHLPWLIELCTSIERREDGLVWGKFECLKGRGNQVERLLFEAGAPRSVGDLARTINHRVVSFGQRPVAETNLGNQLVGDDRFIPIGRSGMWSLRSWEHVHTKNIVSLMEQFLIMQNKPATVEDIYSYVSERRRVSKNSIITYLVSEKERFCKVSTATWGLATWSDTITSDVWNTEQIADFVAELFKKFKTREMDYRIVKEALMEEAKIGAGTAQALLNFNPVIKTRNGKKSGERVAIFQPNYRHILAEPEAFNVRSKQSALPRIEAKVRSILESAPGRQMSMIDLIRELQKQEGYAESTLYNYIAQIHFIERLEGTNHNQKICHLKEVREGTNSRYGGTLREKIMKSVKLILESAPNKQISLTDLVYRLQKEYSCPKATLYQYIAHMDDVEKISIPNSSTKICRIKDMHTAQLSQQAMEISNVLLRENVLRALPDLNLDKLSAWVTPSARLQNRA